MAYRALEALDGSKTALSSLDRVEGTDPPAYKIGRHLPTYCGALWGGQNRTYLPIAWGLTRGNRPPIWLQAYFLHTPVPESTLFVTRRKNSAEIEPWGAPRA